MFNYSIGTEVYLALYSHKVGESVGRVSPATITRHKKNGDKVVGVFVKEHTHGLETFLHISRFGELVFNSRHEAEKAIRERQGSKN